MTRVKELAEDILRKNEYVIRKIVGAVRRVRASGVTGVTVCIRPESKEITAWAYGFGGRPVLYCGEGEKELTIYFRTPYHFLSRREVAERIAEELLLEKEFEEEHPF